MSTSSHYPIIMQPPCLICQLIKPLLIEAGASPRVSKTQVAGTKNGTCFLTQALTVLLWFIIRNLYLVLVLVLAQSSS